MLVGITDARGHKCQKDVSIVVNPIGCVEGYIFNNILNTIDNGGGDFGFADPGVPGSSHFQATFTSPTPRTWQISINPPPAFVWPSGYYNVNFDVLIAPVLTVNGNPVAWSSLVFGAFNFWAFTGSGGSDGPTFVTDACSTITIDFQITHAAQNIWHLYVT